MDIRLPNDPEIVDTIGRYVIWAVDDPIRARYTSLLNANLLCDYGSEQAGFETALAEDAREISDTDLAKLLSTEWRSRLTAAWLIGLDQRTQYRQTLGELLLASNLIYAGQGYCFALARFGQPEDAEILVAYLDRHLPRADCHYDQDWAIGALLYLDDKLGTDHAERFLAPGGSWHQSAFADRDPTGCQLRTAELCNFADRLVHLGLR
ncbi:DUF6000 family protein [Actinomadura scrupuli]|uniref:DUF6000 family protein n=1 Tax=Actinomadura scrupuli TaxID=559629 RepID=UPI003D95EF68